MVKIMLTLIGGVIVGAIFSFLLCRRYIIQLQRRIRNGKSKIETTKKVIWICLINGFAWVWCSYVLAYLDKVQIAESLSQVAVTEIIGVVLAYCIKSAVENLSKNNHWPDKQFPSPDAEPPESEQ